MVTRRSLIVGIAALPIGAALLPRKSFAQSAQFDYYIGPNGSDSNAGSATSPWSISALNTKWSTYAGKRVGLLDGTYDLTTFAKGPYTVKLAVASGTAGSPTVVQAVNPRQAILSCNASSSGYVWAPIIGNGDYEATGAVSYSPQYITLKDLVVTGGSDSGISFGGVNPKDSHGIVIDGCEVYNIVNPNNNNNIGCIKSSMGVVGILINNCHLHDCYTSGQPRNVHGNSSGVHSTDNGMILQNTTIHDCNNAIYQKNTPATPPPDGMTVKNCYFWYGSSGMSSVFCGFNNAFGTTPPYSALTVCNNVFENVPLYYDGNGGVSGLQAPVYFYNNTVYAAGSDGGLGHWTLTAAAVAAGVRVSFYNNILVRGSVNPEWGDLTLGPAYGDWTVCDYNCYPSGPMFGITASDATPPTSFLSLAAWVAVAGTPDRHSKSGDPGFAGSVSAGVGADQYQLAVTSICRGAGRVGGDAAGAVVDLGAWGGATAVAQIGHDFGAVPDAPKLSVS